MLQKARASVIARASSTALINPCLLYTSSVCVCEKIFVITESIKMKLIHEMKRSKDQKDNQEKRKRWEDAVAADALLVEIE